MKISNFDISYRNFRYIRISNFRLIGRVLPSIPCHPHNTANKKRISKSYRSDFGLPVSYRTRCRTRLSFNIYVIHRYTEVVACSSHSDARLRMANIDPLVNVFSLYILPPPPPPAPPFTFPLSLPYPTPLSRMTGVALKTTCSWLQHDRHRHHLSPSKPLLPVAFASSSWPITINQSVIHSINQSPNLSTNQSTNRSTLESINQPN